MIPSSARQDERPPEPARFGGGRVERAAARGSAGVESAAEPSAGRKGRVMVVDDEAAMGRILVKSLGADGFAVTAFTDPIEALAAIPTHQPEVVLTDVRMPSMNGRDLLDRLRREWPELQVIVMTAYGTVEDAVEMLRAGAYTYVTKPFQHAHLVHQIELALAHRRLLQANEGLGRRDELAVRSIVGGSPAARAMLDMIDRAARADSVVLVTGESGVGKELVAREIHRRSARRDRPFITVNCPAIPSSLIESELFGYERGAFTGADRPKMGLIELSAGGTLLLDEIGEIPAELQAKLLRVLQEREVQRLGGLRQIPVDLRVIAATNRDLEREVAEGRFRADLYYRLKVISIVAPPLRERAEDVPEIAAHFLERIGRRAGRRELRFTDRALAVLRAYRWPGNVRELENAVERVVALAPGPVFDVDDLPPDIAKAAFGAGAEEVGPGERDADRTDSGDGDADATSDGLAGADAAPPGLWPIDYKAARESFERAYLRQVIRTTGGNMARAARLSGISRRHLYEKIERLGLDRDSLK